MKFFPHLVLLSFMATSALAKSAEDYLHDASYKYIAGRHQEAALAVEEGLRENPGDPRLHLLDDLLKQMKDQQRQDQNQSGGGDSKDKQDKKNQQNKQDQKDQQNKDQQDKNGNGSKDQKDKQDKQDEQKKQDQNSPPKDSTGQDKDKQQPKPEEARQGDSTGKGGGQPPHMPGQMSKEEAERLLNSFVDEEKKAQQNRQRKPRKGGNMEQDW